MRLRLDVTGVSFKRDAPEYGVIDLMGGLVVGGRPI